ncbi:MAG: hypothetical protein OHK0031_11450 [Anaerolineales bacterium]
MPRKIFFPLISLWLAALACNLPVPTPAPAADWPPRTKAPSATPNASGTEAVLSPAQQNCFNSYQPVAVGASWAYQISGITNDTYTRSITAVSADGFSGQDVFASGATRSSDWKCAGGDLADLSGGANVAAGGANFSFVTKASSGISLPAKLQPGVAWTQLVVLEGEQDAGGQKILTRNNVSINCSAVKTETVSVPAGTFDALRLECVTKMEILTVNGDTTTPLASFEFPGSAWYAPGVGMVKSEGEAMGGKTLVVLTSYSLP